MINVDWIGFILASIAVVLAPGPGSVFVARTAATARVRAGLFAIMGIMVGDTCLIVFSLLGVSALFHALPSLFHIIRFVGASYLVYLGLQVFPPNSVKLSAFAQSHDMYFRRAVTITLFNPKAIFFFMAFFPVFIKSAEHGLTVPYATMTVVFMVISATYLLFLVHASAKLAVVFQNNRTFQLVARKFCGCVFIGFGLKVAMVSR
jgi:leucine efflux protein